jgi:hypothetical protein
MLQQLPAHVQEAAKQPLKPRRGVPIAEAHRSRQLAGPRVSLQRYSLADQWTKSLQQFWQGGQPSNTSSSSSSSSSLQQQQQQQQLGADTSSSTAVNPDGSAPGSTAPAVAQGSGLMAQQAAGALSGFSGPVLPQDKPIVAVVTAAGSIMQSVSGSPDGDNVVESHKLVRVLRAYRDNPQVN